MRSVALNESVTRVATHPNDLDRKRIERAMKGRKRYRYVSPVVVPVTGGYRVESACCSRNIDPEGGVVDIALIMYEPEAANWLLFRRNHDLKEWELHSTYDRIFDLLNELNTDEGREFWQ